MLIRFFSFVGEIFFLIHDDVDIDDDIELNVDTEFDVDLVSDPSTEVVDFALFDNFFFKERGLRNFKLKGFFGVCTVSMIYVSQSMD